MTARIGIGVISFAHGHANLYCDRLATYDDVRLVACWDDDAERGGDRGKVRHALLTAPGRPARRPGRAGRDRHLRDQPPRRDGAGGRGRASTSSARSPWR